MPMPPARSGLQLDVIFRVAHPHYDSYTNAFDVSVWKVNGQVSAPIIALDRRLPDDTRFTVVGWGFRRAGGFQSYKLLEIKVPVFNPERDARRSTMISDVKSHFCLAILRASMTLPGRLGALYS
ncbi:hypothetical protein DSO57_1039280 [Entomophthora muscae]|uniref:Uncharacterized protein n=1 Tax=Entomophthora muscae TaxID=34485 RepID=A0ACC2TAB0_9FUNG|nr:hypothetical protein DSO57_1039280 [Entomophthora muscae]